MEKNYSHPENFVINLKQLPPIDPCRIMNSSFGGKLGQSSTRAAPKVVKPRPCRGMKMVKSDEAHRKSNSSSIRANTSSHTDSVDDGTKLAPEGMKQGSARSNLYEICAARHWKPPIFDCCKEEGPSHHKKFTFKVIIEIEAVSKTNIECFGSPHQKKKTAADHAAEGALWYLKHQGYGRKNQKDR